MPFLDHEHKCTYSMKDLFLYTMHVMTDRSINDDEEKFGVLLARYTIGNCFLGAHITGLLCLINVIHLQGLFESPLYLQTCMVLQMNHKIVYVHKPR